MRKKPPDEAAAESPAGQLADASEESAPDSGAEAELSRTLFSFLEPSLNTIGSFGAPLVIGGIVSLIVGVILWAFVSSLRAPYAYILVGLGVALILLVGLIFLSAVFGAFISRTGRYGVNSLIMLSAFLGIVVVIRLADYPIIVFFREES